MAASTDEKGNFTKEWAMSDMCFKMDDGTLIHVNRMILSLSSPVFKAMLMGNFEEAKKDVIDLPGKRKEEIIQFMDVLHPPNALIDDTNVDVILKYAEEYQIENLTSSCETFLMKSLGASSLVRAERYRIEELEKACIKNLLDTPLQKLREQQEYGSISARNIDKILTYKYKKLESCIRRMMDEIDPVTEMHFVDETYPEHLPNCNRAIKVDYKDGDKVYECICPICLNNKFNDIYKDYLGKN